MTSFVLSPQMKELITRAKAGSGTATCDPRAMYPAGHRCGATTQPIKQTRQYIKLSPPKIDAGGVPVPPDAKITKSVPLQQGGAVTQIETAGGDSIETTTAANGAVEKVTVKNKLLIPAAIAAAFFLLGG